MAKALVVYYSMYGNTEKVAKALAAGLQSGGCEADSTSVEAVNVVPPGQSGFVHPDGTPGVHGRGSRGCFPVG